MGKTRKLTAKRKAFVREYVKDFNGTQAAIRAGYAPGQAGKQAYQLLEDPRVQAAITEFEAKATDAAIATYSEACEILTSIARGNVADYMGEDGGIDRDKLRTSHPEAVQSIEAKSSVDGDDVVTTTKFRLHDPVRALERLAKLRGWDQPTRTEVEATVTTGPDLGKLSDDELATVEALLEKAAM